MRRRPTWNDLNNAPQSDLKRIYKIDSRGLEREVRRHWDGSSYTEKRKLYESVFNHRKE